jgi:hypothetical protein
MLVIIAGKLCGMAMSGVADAANYFFLAAGGLLGHQHADKPWQS